MNVKSDFEAHMEQPKSSGKKWFACGGIGCILLLLMCGGGIATVVAIAWPVVTIVGTDIPTRIKENPQVIAAVGEPVEVGPPEQKGQNQETVMFEFDVSGPDGNGTANAAIRWKSFSEWAIDSLTVDVDDQTIDILASEEVEVDIDDGDDK
jgi:hypothetical protein